MTSCCLQPHLSRFRAGAEPPLPREGRALEVLAPSEGFGAGGGTVRAHFGLLVLALHFPVGVRAQTVPSSVKLEREEKPPESGERSSSSCRLSSPPGEEGAAETSQGSGFGRSPLDMEIHPRPSSTGPGLAFPPSCSSLATQYLDFKCPLPHLCHCPTQASQIGFNYYFPLC